jgi:mannose-6-phosphate isomerase
MTANMKEVIRLQPLYQDRVWGGRALSERLGRALPDGRVIGESWEIVDRPEAQSVVQGGAFAGKTLRELLAREPAHVMGPSWPAERPFPILVKWLDCRERLSLQVHPPAALAPSLKGEPKTENWYIAETTASGAALLVGLREGVTRTQFEQALAGQTAEACVRRLTVSRGDSILVRSGTVHAIDAGNLILEIQQNSDTTYRVYDWGRVGLDGKPRALHVEESLASILWDEPPPPLVPAAPTDAVLAECAEFRLRRVVLAPGQTLAIPAGEQPRILSVVDGRLERQDEAGEAISRGDNLLLPYAGDFVFAAAGATTVLLTENFTGAAAGKA